MAPSDLFYKKLEQNWNRQIHDQCNCRTFTKAIGNALQAHLDQIIVQKKIITEWLDKRNFANKDEIAVLAEKVINCEDKLDSLEDALFVLNKKQKEIHIQIETIKQSVVAIRELFQKELKANKIQTLEDELTDLKKLFDKKENKND